MRLLACQKRLAGTEWCESRRPLIRAKVNGRGGVGVVEEGAAAVVEARGQSLLGENARVDRSGVGGGDYGCGCTN